MADAVDALFKGAGLVFVLLWRLAWWQPRLTIALIVTWMVAASLP